MADHALLSPSSASRWLNCPAAPRLEEGVPDKGSPYAAEGTLAHAYCAWKLKAYLGLDFTGEKAEMDRLDAEYHTGEMDEHTDAYAAYVMERYNAALSRTPDAQLLVETRLDFSRYVPEAFGTADALIIADGTLEVIDFKYGKGVRVEAERNPQMMIYALGAWERFNMEYRIERVRMTIVQPRLDNVSQYELSAAGLLAWASYVLTPRAREAWSGDGAARAGTWCRFCKVRSTCRALADASTGAAARHPDPRLLSADELARDVLPRLETVRTWLQSVEAYALEQALGGTRLPGWKLVEGRSVRRVTDPDAVAAALCRAGYKTPEIYKPQELRGITELEKLAGRREFAALCGQYVDKPAGKPTLVPESDRRPALSDAAADFKDVKLHL